MGERARKRAILYPGRPRIQSVAHQGNALGRFGGGIRNALTPEECRLSAAFYRSQLLGSNRAGEKWNAAPGLLSHGHLLEGGSALRGSRAGQEHTPAAAR